MEQYKDKWIWLSSYSEYNDDRHPYEVIDRRVYGEDVLLILRCVNLPHECNPTSYDFHRYEMIYESNLDCYRVTNGSVLFIEKENVDGYPHFRMRGSNRGDQFVIEYCIGAKNSDRVVVDMLNMLSTLKASGQIFNYVIGDRANRTYKCVWMDDRYIF